MNAVQLVAGIAIVLVGVAIVGARVHIAHRPHERGNTTVAANLGWVLLGGLLVTIGTWLLLTGPR